MLMCTIDFNRPFLAATVLLSAAAVVQGLNNGLAITPPMGFRTWNQFGIDVNATMMVATYKAMAARTRLVDGVLTSLVDVGYTHAGIDDGWQMCDTGAGGAGFHNASGYPQVDTAKFPSMTELTQQARNLNITPGWYANNCHCADHSKTCTGSDACYHGDVGATIDFGFASLKVDSCGSQKNFSEYAPLFNRTGQRVLLENCHEGTAVRLPNGEVSCPMNLFRSSKDIRPTYGSIIGNLLTVDQFNSAGLTGPGCWAYPDMLEVGVTAPQPPGAKHHCETPTTPCRMNATEWQTHFSAWAINSAPLVLGLDLTDDVALAASWDIITNREVIAINKAWVGDAGRLVAQDSATVVAPNCGSGKPCDIPGWLVYAKHVPVPVEHTSWGRTAAAVLLINNAQHSATVSADLSQIQGLGACDEAHPCVVRDVVARASAPNITTASVTAPALAPHASHLVVITSAYLTPSPPAPSRGNCAWIPQAGLTGGDIKFVNVSTKEACCAACVAEPQCAAACFRPPTHHGKGGVGCHMKSSLKTDPNGPGDDDAVVCVPHH